MASSIHRHATGKSAASLVRPSVANSKRTMGLEPTTLSLGSLSSAAWLDVNRKDKRNHYR